MDKEQFPVGTVVKVVNVDDSRTGGYGDKRNEGRTGTIASVILPYDPDHPTDGILYEVHFNDGVVHDSPHWMDAEAGFCHNGSDSLGNSAHYHTELAIAVTVNETAITDSLLLKRTDNNHE
jgi:hypothetical protein